VQRGVIQSLRAILEEWGLSLQGVTHLGFQKAQDAVTMERQTNSIKQAINDIRLQAEIDQMENEAVLEHARVEFGLTEADIADYQAQSAQATSRTEAMIALLEEKLDRIRQGMEERLDSLAEEQKAVAPPTQAPAPSHKNLERLVVSLRIVFYIIAAITAANALFYRYLPFLNQYDDHFHLAGSILGLLLALAALATAWLVDRRRVFQIQQAQNEYEKRLSKAEQERAIARERGIRNYFEKRLRRVAENCDEAMKRVYNKDIGLATEIRQKCVGPYERLANTVRAAAFDTARFTQNTKLDIENLQRLLTLSETLLSKAEEMTALSLQIHDSTTNGDTETTKTLITKLDRGRKVLEDMFDQREQFLMS